MNDKVFSYNNTSDTLDWNELSNLYKVSFFGNKSAKNLEIMFNNSLYKYFVYDNLQLIGAGRVVSDGVEFAYITGIVVHPNYQKKGLGTQIVKELVEKSKLYDKIILYSYPEDQKFYLNLGFNKMKTAMGIFKDKKKSIRKGIL